MNNRLDLVVLELSSIVRGAAHAQAEAFLTALVREGIHPGYEEIRSVLGLPLSRAIRALFPTGMNLCADVERAERLQVGLVAALRRRFSRPDACAEAPGTTSVLEALHAQGLRVALVTSLPRSVADSMIVDTTWYRRGLVDTVITGDDSTAERLLAGPIQEAMRRTRVDSARAVVAVGESTLFLRQADAAGCAAVAATAFEGASPSEHAQRAVTHAVVTRMTAVLDVIAMHDVGRRAPSGWPASA